jgi:hypothetical protein
MKELGAEISLNIIAWGFFQSGQDMPLEIYGS